MKLKSIFFPSLQISFKQILNGGITVLKALINNFVTVASENFKQYADIDGYDCPSRLFRSSRQQDPDADKYRLRSDTVIQEKNKTTIIELTCLFKTNLEKSRD